MSEGLIESLDSACKKTWRDGGPLCELSLTVDIITKPKLFEVSPVFTFAPHPSLCFADLIIPLQSHFTTV